MRSERKLKLEHLPFLDGVRGIAVIFVVMYHYGLLSIGWVGVDLFFALSGFLISIKLIESNDENNRKYYFNFWVKRVLRIVPAYYFILTLCFASILIFKVNLIGQNHSLWAYPLFIVNWQDSVKGWPAKYSFIHFWSLSCEMQFYLVWPFFLKAFLRQKKLLLSFLIALVLFAVFTRFMTQFYFNYPIIANYVLLPCRIDSFALGALLAVLIKFYKEFINIPFVRVINSCCVVLILLTIAFKYSEWTFSNSFVNTIGLSLNAFLGFGTLILLFNGTLSFFKSRLLILLGKYSYGLYLYHLPVWLLVKKLPFNLPGNEIIISCVAAIITYLVSWLSYNLFEVQFLQLKRKI